MLYNNILSTIAYYDIMDYPMTAFEIWKYLIAQNVEHETHNADDNKCSLAQVIQELESQEIKKYIEEYQGFYFLRGKKDLVGQRLERNKISETKYKIILRMAKLLKFVPYIKMIAVVGRVAMKNAEKESDLDLFFIFERGRIFTGRFLVFLLLSFLRKKRKEEKIKNRICLNHFLSDKFSVSVKDLFSSHEYCFMLPVFNFETYEKFLEKNSWIKNYRPNFDNETSSLKEEKNSRFSKTARKILKSLFSFKFIETGLKKIQSAKIKVNPKTQKEGGVIIYNDNELAFWPEFEKQGPLIFDKFKSRLLELENKQI